MKLTTIAHIVLFLLNQQLYCSNRENKLLIVKEDLFSMSKVGFKSNILFLFHTGSYHFEGSINALYFPYLKTTQTPFLKPLSNPKLEKINKTHIFLALTSGATEFGLCIAGKPHIFVDMDEAYLQVPVLFHFSKKKNQRFFLSLSRSCVVFKGQFGAS